MATNGIAKSWTVPNGYVTNEGNSYAGAYYSWEWESSVKSPGVTTVTWKLYGNRPRCRCSYVVLPSKLYNG